MFGPEIRSRQAYGWAPPACARQSGWFKPRPDPESADKSL